MNKSLVSVFTIVSALGLARLASSPSDRFAEATTSSSESVLRLESAASHPLLLAGAPRDVYLYLSLQAKQLERPKVERPSMNLALVIDRSGSMASENKLLYAKSAAEQLVGRLRADDHLAIAVYDDTVQTVVPSTPAGERDVFLAAIRGIESGNSTNLHGGMMAGYEEVLKHFDEKRLNRVLLLSDGLANIGVIDPLSIRARASQCRERGVRISTMGMGLSYDEDLMSGIAHASGGNYYYVGDAETVGLHLDHELDGLSNVVARDLELHLKLAPGVVFGDAYGYTPSIEGQLVTIPVPDMIDQERKKVVVRLRVQGEVGASTELATARLGFVDTTTQAAGAVQNDPLVARFTDDVAEVELHKRMDVLIKVEVVRNAEATLAAMDLQQQGLYEEAQQLLGARYRNCKLMNDTEYRSAELTEMILNMKQMLLEIERTKTDPRARRDLQLYAELRALGYASSD